MTEDTYDIELADASIEDLGIMVTGLSTLALQLAQAEQMGRGAQIQLDGEEVMGLQERLFVENRELARDMILTAGSESDIELEVNLDQDLLDELGLKQVGGRVVDAEGGGS